MGVKWITKKNELPQMTRRAESLDGRSVEIGCIEGDHAWLAGIHEYGCNITVTPKMRAFMHYKGVHLSPSKTSIRIPERSFLRNGHDTHANNVLDKTSMAAIEVVRGKMSEQQLLDMTGQMLSTQIKEYATSLSSPPNAPLTVAWKGSSNPLVDTGSMIEGISWRVK